MPSLLLAREAQLKRFQDQGGTLLAVELDSCAILAKTVAVFCPCSKNLPEAKLTHNRLASLAREIQGSLTLMVMRLSAIPVMQSYSQKQQAGQEEMPNVQLREKRTRKLSVVAKACAKRDKTRPGVNRNKGRGTIRERPSPNKPLIL